MACCAKRATSATTVIFYLGMYLVIYGLRNAGLTEMIAGLLDYLATHGCEPYS